MSDESPPSARFVIELDSLRAGVIGGGPCVAIVAALFLLGGRAEDDPGGVTWTIALWGALLFSYALAGYGAARARPLMPLTHGILVGFVCTALWIALRVIAAAVRDLGPLLPLTTLATNLIVGPTFAMFGAMLGMRYAPTPKRSVDGAP